MLGMVIYGVCWYVFNPASFLHSRCRAFTLVGCLRSYKVYPSLRANCGEPQYQSDNYMFPVVAILVGKNPSLFPVICLFVEVVAVSNDVTGCRKLGSSQVPSQTSKLSPKLSLNQENHTQCM